MVDATNADSSAGCVHIDLIAERVDDGRLHIRFTEAVLTLKPDEFYAATIFARNSVGNTASNGTVEFSK